MKIGDLVRISEEIPHNVRSLTAPRGSLGVIVGNATDLYQQWHKFNPDWEPSAPRWNVYCSEVLETYTILESDLEVIDESR